MRITDVTAENETMKNEIGKIARPGRQNRRLIILVIVLALVLVLAAAIWLSGIAYAKQMAENDIAELEAENQKLKDEIDYMVHNPVVIDPVTPEIDLKLLESEILSIGELATTEYLFTNAARFSDAKGESGLAIWVTEKAFVVRWDGAVKAGINLELVDIKVNEEDKRIAVFVPQAEVLSYEVFTDTVEVLDEKNNLFNPISIEDKTKFDAATEQEMIQRAIDNCLLEKAQENAERILRELLLTNEAIGNAYEISFTVFAA